MNIMITGGAGFIGSHLAKKLVSLGHNVLILDNFESGTVENLAPIKHKVKIIKGDILDIKLIHKNLLGIDVIFHLAAKVTVSDSFADKKIYEQVNTQGTKGLLEAASKHKVAKFIFASSAAVYGGNQNLPLCETSQTKPISPLGDTKLRAESYCTLFRRKGLDSIVLRFFNVYGPGQNPVFSNVIPNFISQFLSNQVSTIHGDGNQTRDFVYIDDVADACIKSLGHIIGNEYIFNIASGKEYTINQIFNSLSNILGNLKTPLYIKKREGDIDRSLACICKAKKYLKISPKVSLYNGLLRTAELF